MLHEKYPLPIDVKGIKELIPHRYPFLLVDRVVEFEPGKRVRCYKNVTVNEHFFLGHFPERPVMPGVLIIEALAQAGGILTNLSRDNRDMEATSYLVKVDGVKFMSMVKPGDRLDMEVSLKRFIRNVSVFTGVASVDGVEVACAEIVCAESRE